MQRLTRYLVEKGLSVNCRLATNLTIPHVLAYTNNINLFTTLLKDFDDIDVCNDFGATPLTTAAGEGQRADGT